MEVQTAFWIVAMLVLLALAFDFMNGFHDAANSIATVVSTGVLKPGQAVIFAGFFNGVAIFIFGFAVAATMGHTCRFRCSHRRYFLEYGHMVLRHTQQLFACTGRRNCGCGRNESWRQCSYFQWHYQNCHLHFCLAIAWFCHWIIAHGRHGLDIPQNHTVQS